MHICCYGYGYFFFIYFCTAFSLLLCLLEMSVYHFYNLNR